LTVNEIFSQQRIERCGRLCHAIMDNWQQSRPFLYVVRATESLHGLSLADLKSRYFSVGVADNGEFTDLPLTDLLVLFSMVEQTVAAIKKVPEGQSSGSIDYKIRTVFSDEVAIKLLSRIRIETPFDDASHLAIDQLLND